MPKHVAVIKAIVLCKLYEHLVGVVDGVTESVHRTCRCLFLAIVLGQLPAKNLSQEGLCVGRDPKCTILMSKWHRERRRSCPADRRSFRCTLGISEMRCLPRCVIIQPTVAV